MVEICDPWDNVKSQLQPDGSLRDIFIPGASPDHWDRFLHWVMNRNQPIVFRHGMAVTKLPDSLEDIRKLQESDTVLLTFPAGKLRLNCHFFEDDEMEFDLDPRSIAGEGHYDDLTGLMASFSALMGKTVYLTRESAPDQVITAISPNAKVVG